MIRTLALRRLPFAVLGGVLLVAGTLAGSAVYAAGHPTYDRIVWIDRSGADASSVEVVRRALFTDGRFLALTAAGYRGGGMNLGIATSVFSTVAAEGPGWQAEYRSGAVINELIDLRFEGTTTRTIRIWNPASNTRLPRALAKVLLILSAGDRNIAKTAFAPAGLLFHATKVGDSGGAAVETLPIAFPLVAASAAAGARLGGSDLAVLGSVWPDLFARLAPGHDERFVKVEGQVWRISWTLDLESVGPLSQAGPGATP